MARQTPYIGAMFQWNLNFQMDVPQPDEKWGFGIVHADYSGRPAYFPPPGLRSRLLIGMPSQCRNR